VDLLVVASGTQQPMLGSLQQLFLANHDGRPDWSSRTINLREQPFQDGVLRVGWCAGAAPDQSISSFSV
jgi:hypothetical protein